MNTFIKTFLMMSIMLVSVTNFAASRGVCPRDTKLTTGSGHFYGAPGDWSEALENKSSLNGAPHGPVKFIGANYQKDIFGKRYICCGYQSLVSRQHGYLCSSFEAKPLYVEGNWVESHPVNYCVSTNRENCPFKKL